jgi:hypothetical protein
MVIALVTVGFSFDGEPTVNSQDELTVATSGSQGLSRRSNCNLCACSFPPCATRSPAAGTGRACPTLPGSAAMYTEGTASRPPTAEGLANIGVQSGSADLFFKVCGSSHRSHPRTAESTERVCATRSVITRSIARRRVVAPTCGRIGTVAWEPNHAKGKASGKGRASGRSSDSVAH